MVVIALACALLPFQVAQGRAATPRDGQAVDESLRHHPGGLPYYVDPVPELVPTASTQTNARTSATAAALDQTFLLHSFKGSARTIYLDFNGYTLPTSNTWATTQGGPISPGAITGFSRDGSAAFSSAELTQIQAIWRIVAEKFAPFNIDVTTQDPGTAALSRATSADQNYGVRVVITDDPDPANQACGGGCGGVANVGTFNFVSATSAFDPAWVFSSNGNTPIIAQSIAHEVGHNFGLSHDGVTTSSGDNYYGGQGNWLPIMGLATNGKAISQWSKGEYADANNTQDDLAIIATGAPRRADDAGNSTAAPTALATIPTYVRNGVIGSAADKDVYRVTRSCTGALNASATTIGAGGSLDLSLELLNSAGTVLDFDNPASGTSFVGGDAVPDGVNASTSAGTVGPGTYYVRLDGVGSANPLTDGYSDYSSVGQYRLTISGCPATKPTAARIGTPSSGARGGTRNAVARWAAPVSTGGAPITAYKVVAYQLSSTGKVIRTRVSSARGAGARSYTWALPAGRYKFRVIAYNQVGGSPFSGYSRIVTSR